MKTSVALCTYNGEKYLKQQLDSILQQSVEVEEIIVCDDRSTDSTWSILEKYADRYPQKIKIHRNEVNIGFNKNFEKAILLSNGDIIFLCDQDDIWFENKVEEICKVAVPNPEKTVFAHKIKVLEEDSTIRDVSFWDEKKFDLNSSNSQILRFLLFERNVFPGMTLAITKEAVNKYFPLKKINKVIIHDYELILRSAAENRFFILDKTLALYRKHDNQTIGINTGAVTAEKRMDKSVLYGYIKRQNLVDEIITTFNFDKNLLSEYKHLVRNEYRKFLKSLPLPSRWIYHVKMKHYYKVLNGIS